jgi:arginine exporter protein ArgO
LLNIWFKDDIIIIISEWWTSCPPRWLLVAPSKLGLECLGWLACADSAHAKSGEKEKAVYWNFIISKVSTIIVIIYVRHLNPHTYSTSVIIIVVFKRIDM